MKKIKILLLIVIVLVITAGAVVIFANNSNSAKDAIIKDNISKPNANNNIVLNKSENKSTNTNNNSNVISISNSHNVKQNSNNTNNSLNNSNINQNANNTNNSFNNANSQKSDNQFNTESGSVVGSQAVIENNQMNTGNADFKTLLGLGNYLDGQVSAQNNVLICTGVSTVLDNMLVVPAYYANDIHKEFIDYIASEENNKFIIYQTYNGNVTATYNLQIQPMNGISILKGTMKNNLNSQVQNIIIYPSKKGESCALGEYPFVVGTVGTTNLAIANTNLDNYFEYYQNDNNRFELKLNYNEANQKYPVALDEYYKGKKTAEYLLKGNREGSYTGFYIKEPYVSGDELSPVVLQGSYTPN